MDHPIHTLLKVSLENIKEMIDVDTIVGEAIKAGDTTIIPVSKVKMGFLAGGTEIKNNKETTPPFGGGTGGSVTISPIAFLVCTGNDVKVLHLEQETHLIEKLIDKIPDLANNIQSLFKDENKPTPL